MIPDPELVQYPGRIQALPTKADPVEVLGGLAIPLEAPNRLQRSAGLVLVRLAEVLVEVVMEHR